MRPDLLPDDYIAELSKLLDDVPPMNVDVVLETIAQELGADASVLFATFDLNPIAAASFGQVHRAVLKDGDRVEVSLRPEGPQADGLAPDIASALDANPEARRFFESLATFYRKGWLTWIDATKRRPEVRVERIAQMVELLSQGHKQRPRGG